MELTSKQRAQLRGMAAGPVSYTHLDVYKRQTKGYTEQDFIAVARPIARIIRDMQDIRKE